jgi:hypothetical protein
VAEALGLGSRRSSCRLHFGSFQLRLTADNRYVDVFPDHFRLWPGPDDGTPPDLDLAVDENPDASEPVEQLDDPLEMEVGTVSLRLTTAITRLDVDLRGDPAQARLLVRPRTQAAAYVDHYVAMNIRALLRVWHRLQLHGAAVVMGDRTSVFLGDKGAGKTTIALALGHAGAIVLADDQLMLRSDGDHVSISGVDGRLRVTASTERHFFAAPLATEARDFAGTLKKEVSLGDHVNAQPGVDHAPDALYFPRVGGRLEVTRISRADALRRVLAPLAPLHRFAGANDQQEFVRMVTAFVSSVDVFDLTLSTDLDDLRQLAAVVERPVPS